MIHLFVATPTPLRAENYTGGRIVIPRLKVNPGTSQRLAIQLSNSEEFTAFQAEITFPEGITPVKTSNESYSVSLSSRKVDHTISANIISNGALKIAAFSMSNESLKDKSGDLFYIDITSDAAFTGPATIEVKGILFTQTEDRKEIAFPDVNVIADINYAAGDANIDGFINAADIVEVVNYIKGSPSDKFNEESADANGDKKVDAADIETIKNIIMGIQ
jgi:hypothetical protein